jgi:predicted Zn finger-like uncharacterized protein
MKVPCGQCPAKYAIADERIHGKKVRIRCKRCGAGIVVDGKVDPPRITSEAASQAASDSVPPSSPRPEAKTILGGLEAPTHLFDRRAPQSPPPPRPAPGAARAGMPAAGRGFTEPPAAFNGTGSWRVAMTENDLRWMTTSQIIDAYRDGVVKPETFVLREGMSHWQTLLEVEELAEAVGESVAPGLSNGKASDAASDVPPSVPPPRKPGSGRRPALLDQDDDDDGSHAKMTKLGLGLNLKPQSPGSLENEREPGGPAPEHARGKPAARVDESFLTLPFTDAEAIESVPSPKVSAPDLTALPAQQPAALEPLEPEPLPELPIPHLPDALPDAPLLSASAQSPSLWPWLLAVALVAAAVAAAVVFSR